MVSGREIKNKVESMLSNGKDKASVKKELETMGVDGEIASFLIGLYGRKLNQLNN